MPYTKTQQQILITRARSGDEAARAKLIEQHHRVMTQLIRQQMSYFAVPAHLQKDLIEDLTQEGNRYLDKVIMKQFDLSRNIWLWSFAKTGVLWVVREYLKAQQKHWKNRLPPSGSDFNGDQDLAGAGLPHLHTSSHEDEVIHRIMLRQRLQQVMSAAVRLLRYQDHGEWVEQGVKLIVLIVLEHGEGIRLRVLAAILATPPISDWRPPWSAIHRYYGLPPEIPTEWDAVRAMFQTKASPSLASPGATLDQLEERLKQFLRRQTRKLREELRAEEDPGLDR